MTEPIDVCATAYGTKAAEAISRSGAHLGYETSRSRPPDSLEIEFCDYNFRDRTPFEEHLAAVEREQPKLAVAPDVQDAADLDEATEQADHLAEHAETVIMVPKGVHPTEIPDRHRVGLPLANWDIGADGDPEGFFDTRGKPVFHQWTEYRDVDSVHLLGGGPKLQLHVSKFGIPVESVDGASVIKAARSGGLFTPEKWIKTTRECPPLYEKMRHSLDNLVRAWSVRYNYRPAISPEVYDASECPDPAESDSEDEGWDEAENIEAERRMSEAGYGPPTITPDEADLWSPQDHRDGVVPESIDWDARINESEERAMRAAERALRADGGQTGFESFSPDEADEKKQSPTVMGFGDYRQRSLDRLDATPHLSPIKSFGSIDEMVEAVEELHIPGYSKPPERIVEGLRRAYDELPSDEARRYYLNDYKLGRTINAARRAFNDWVSRKKRYDQIPGWAEAGPSNYPVRKHRKASDSERRGKEEFDEKIERLRGRVNGARSRALKKAGSSVAEQNEIKREKLRDAKRDELSEGDLVVFRNPNIHTGRVVRVNQKSVRIEYPNPLRGGTLWNSDEPQPETLKTTQQLDSSFLKKLPKAEVVEGNFTKEGASDVRDALIETGLLPEAVEADDTDTDDSTDMTDSSLIDELKAQGIPAQGAKAIASKFTTLDEAFGATASTVENLKGVGPSSLDAWQKARKAYQNRDDEPDEADRTRAFDPRDLFADDVEFTEEIEWQDVAHPENVPRSEKEVEIDLARRILQAGGARTGFSHHEDVRASMGRWSTEHEDDPDNPGYWREMHYKLTPYERSSGNFGSDDIDPDEQPQKALNRRYQKARTVIAWASDNIDADVLREIEDEQAKAAADAWLKEGEKQATARADAEFERDPPDEVNGWERWVDHGKDDVVLAYRGMSHGIPSVAAMYELPDGSLAAGEYALSDWFTRKPAKDIGKNSVVLIREDRTVYGELRAHLEAFDGAEPIPENINGWERYEGEWWTYINPENTVWVTVERAEKNRHNVVVESDWGTIERVESGVFGSKAVELATDWMQNHNPGDVAAEAVEADDYTGSFKDKHMENAHYWAAQALWWMKEGPNAGIDGRYYVEIIGGKPVIVMDDSWNEDTVNAVKDGLRDYGFPLPLNERELDDEWRLFVSKPTDERLVSGDADWREFESQTDFEDTKNPEQAADDADQWTDDRADRGAGQGLELFGMEIQEGTDSTSREHRAAQNKGYLATPREPTSVENEREGLGRFGVRTADTKGLEQFERQRDSKLREKQPWGESEIRGKRLTQLKVGQIRHHAANDDLWLVLNVADIDGFGADNLRNEVGDVAGLVAYYDTHGGFGDIDKVGPKMNDRLVEIVPLVRDAIGDEPTSDEWDAEKYAREALDAADAKADALYEVSDEDVWGPAFDGLSEVEWALGKDMGASVSDLDVSNFLYQDDETREYEEEDTATGFAAFANLDATAAEKADLDALNTLDAERDAEQEADEQAIQSTAEDDDGDGDRKKLSHRFDTREAANLMRDELPDGVETSKYDRRHKTVEVYADALSEKERDTWETETLDDQRESDVKYGQADLTDDEKKRLKKRDGWTWGTHGFHARSAKAILTYHGVSDWLAKYDHTIEAREHLSLVPQQTARIMQFDADATGAGAQRGGGANYTDADEDDAAHVVARRAKSAKKAQGEECHHAEEWCGKGDEAACVHLVSDCGWTDEEIEEMRADVAEMEVRMDSLITDDGGPIQEGEEAVTAEVVEAAGGDGTELPPFALRTLQRAWNGFRAAALEAEEGKKAIENYNDALREAREYGSMVNEVRARFGQEPMEIETTVTVKTEGGKKEQRTVALADLPRLVNVEWGDAGTNAPTAETEGTTLFGRLGGLFEFDAPTYDPMIDMATDGGVAVAANATATSLLDIDYQKALEHHRRRSPKAQDMDEGIQAREQVVDFETWVQAPNQMDFVGIDSIRYR
jgi:hypothetical protein